MLANRKLILDTFCEVYDLLKPWADGEFWSIEKHNIIPDAIYLIGRQTFLDNRHELKVLADQGVAKFILSNPHEGSDTMRGLILQCGIEDLVKQKKILIIAGGDMEPNYPCLQYDSFLPKLYDYDENLAAAQQVDSLYNHDKPYKFLFLNGRIRAHRKYLLEKFRLNGLLDQCLWTNLDSNPGSGYELQLWHDGNNLMLGSSVTQSLPIEYEVDRYRDYINQTTDFHYKKYVLFNNEWGEIYLEPKPYQDTYFSLVTETVFSYPYSFRTEKIWKPIAIGHPFIVVANTGFYRDLHNLGFQTFAHVIDESFDLIVDNQKRIERIVEVVDDLCSQDLASLMKQCYNVCKYNQQHLAEMRIKVRQEFPERFFQFIKRYHFDE